MGASSLTRPGAQRLLAGALAIHRDTRSSASAPPAMSESMESNPASRRPTISLSCSDRRPGMAVLLNGNESQEFLRESESVLYQGPPGQGAGLRN